MTDTTDSNNDRLRYVELERAAYEIAERAGSIVVDALSRDINVEYKDTQRSKGDSEPIDPVTEIDRRVEEFVREEVGKRFPGHAVLGEEQDSAPDPKAEYVWAIDPVDGTTNFVNKFPFFSASIGILRKGYPVVGAVWSSTTHKLQPGVYHAVLGGTLKLDNEEILGMSENSGLRRSLSAVPGGGEGRTPRWDTRVVGSTAVECVYVAVGILRPAQFWRTRAWDVAGGIVLARANGKEVYEFVDGEWEKFKKFVPPQQTKGDKKLGIRDWSESLIVGSEEDLDFLSTRLRRPGIIKRAARRILG